jgi:hypothetical protein
MIADRERRLLQGVLLTALPLLFVKGAPLLVPLEIARRPSTAWVVVACMVMVAVAQAFGLVRLNQSRAGLWRDGKAIVAVVLSVAGWLLLLLYGAVALAMFGYALSPGNRLFQ